MKALIKHKSLGRTFADLFANKMPAINHFISTTQPVGQLARVLIVEDDLETLKNLKKLLQLGGYDVSCASTIDEANELISRTLGTERSDHNSSRPFSMVILDLNVGVDNGGEFGRRLLEIVGNINIIVMTGSPEMAVDLPYQPDAIIIKGAGVQNLLSTMESFIKPVRHQVLLPPHEKIMKWHATSMLKGINTLRSFTKVGGCEINDDGVTKITAVTKNNEWVNLVIYPYQVGKDADTIFIGISPLLGCPVACKFCKNWRYQKDNNGNDVNFKRKLTVDEIISQVYLAMNSQAVKNAFKYRLKQKLVVNFTVMGDVAFNMKNSCLAAEQLLGIKRPEISIIFTSVGTSESLREYLRDYIHLPRIRHYFSVNSLDTIVRAWLMPGTKDENLEELRNLYQEIAIKTGKPITASWVVIKGLNDRQEDAEMIASYFNDRPFEIKLMALVDGSLENYPKTTKEDVLEFQNKLLKAGVNIPIRIREILGKNIESGCGNTYNTWAQ